MSLCIGWGLEYIVLIDNDGEGEKIRNELLTECIPAEKIHFVHKDKDNCIEDLFSNEDYRKYIKDEETDIPDVSIKNSELAKLCNNSKALNSRIFYNKIIQDKDKVKLDKETIENFKTLFDKINKFSAELN